MEIFIKSKINALAQADNWQIAEVFDDQSEKILEDLNKTNKAEYGKYKKGTFYISSPSINLRDTDKLSDRYKMCIESLRRSIIALKVAGLNIKIIKVGFSNKQDAQNILGNIGFFYLKYSFKRK